MAVSGDISRQDILKAGGMAAAALAILGVLLNGWIGSLSDQIITVNGRVTETLAEVRGLDDTLGLTSEAIKLRISETNQRIDDLFEAQNQVASRMAAVESNVSYLRNRIDGIADKLEVASAEEAQEDPGQAEAPILLSRTPQDAFEILKENGIQMLGLPELQDAVGPAHWVQAQSLVEQDIKELSGSFIFITDDADAIVSLSKLGWSPIEEITTTEPQQ